VQDQEPLVAADGNHGARPCYGRNASTRKPRNLGAVLPPETKTGGVWGA
jgi:hypothetical protein